MNVAVLQKLSQTKAQDEGKNQTSRGTKKLQEKRTHPSDSSGSPEAKINFECF